MARRLVLLQLPDTIILPGFTLGCRVVHTVVKFTAVLLVILQLFSQLIKPAPVPEQLLQARLELITGLPVLLHLITAPRLP